MCVIFQDRDNSGSALSFGQSRNIFEMYQYAKAMVFTY
jgi:hypothetical protein